MPQWSFRSDFGEIDEANLNIQRQARQKSPFLDLSETNPTCVGLELPPIVPRWGADRENSYCPDPRGLVSARQAIARSYAGRAAVSAEQIVITASTSEAYSHLLDLLCDPGDAVLVPRPSYPLISHLAQLANVRVVEYQLRYDGSWHLDPSSLPCQRELEGLGVRAVLAIDPNNPTGSRLASQELDALQKLGLPLLVDEVFRPYQLAPGGHERAPDPLEDATVPLFVLDGLSKRAALPGLKLGWIIAKGPGCKEALERLAVINDAFLSANQPAQMALAAILENEHVRQQAVHERMLSNYSLLRNLLDGCSLTLLDVRAGWIALLRFPALGSEREYATQLALRGVWAHPGSFYDLPVGPCFAISLLVPPARLSEGVRRMIEVAEGAT